MKLIILAFVGLGLPGTARAQECVQPTSLDIVTEVREASPLIVVAHVEVPSCVTTGPVWTVLRCTSECLPVVTHQREGDPWRTWFSAKRQGLYVVFVFYRSKNRYAIEGRAQFRRGPRPGVR